VATIRVAIKAATVIRVVMATKVATAIRAVAIRIDVVSNCAA
jgi:hypothetical protein